MSTEPTNNSEHTTTIQRDWRQDLEAGADWVNSRSLAFQIDANDLVHLNDIDEETGDTRVTVFASTHPDAGVVFRGVVNLREHLAEAPGAPAIAADRQAHIERAASSTGLTAEQVTEAAAAIDAEASKAAHDAVLRLVKDRLDRTADNTSGMASFTNYVADLAYDLAIHLPETDPLRRTVDIERGNGQGCSCGMADYGAPGHDGDPNRHAQADQTPDGTLPYTVIGVTDNDGQLTVAGVVEGHHQAVDGVAGNHGAYRAAFLVHAASPAEAEETARVLAANGGEEPEPDDDEHAGRNYMTDDLRAGAGLPPLP